MFSPYQFQPALIKKQVWFSQSRNGDSNFVWEGKLLLLFLLLLKRQVGGCWVGAVAPEMVSCMGI